MSHDEAVVLLTDYMAGRLSERVREEVRAHIGSCSECGGLVETIRLLGMLPRDSKSQRSPPAEGTEADPHPSSADIVDYALARARPGGSAPGVVPGRGLDVAAHVQVCTECSDAVRIVTQGEAALGGNMPVDLATRRPEVATRLALAAAAIAAAGMSYLGLYRMPLLQGRIDQLESDRAQERARPEPPAVGTAPADGPPSISATRGAQGALRIQQLPLLHRSGGPLPQLTVISGELVLYLSFESPPLLEMGHVWRFTIVGPTGADAWSWDVPVDELRRLTRSPEIVLAVPADNLSAGRNSLHLQRAGTKSLSLLEVPFMLKRVSSEPAPSK